MRRNEATVPLTSRVGAHGRVTLPVLVRERLGVGPGETIVYSIANDTIVLRRASPPDKKFLRLAQEAFSDWDAPEADEAFRDL